MLCPYCKCKDTRVIDKRDSENELVSRRRRECFECKKRFTTYERIQNLDLKVVKKDGSIQAFDREKLVNGISISANKRLSHETIEEIADDIEMKILNRQSNKVAASDIGRMVLTRLKKVDKVAYMRFASVFLEFGDIEEFKNELKKIED